MVCATDQVLDGEICVPEACGVGPFGGVDADVYVLAGENGDGSRDRPFGAIRQAIEEAAAAGGVVAVGAGAYQENLSFDGEFDGVEITGRCADMVRIDGSGRDEPTIYLKRGRRKLNVALSGVTLAGGTVGVYADGATLTVHDAVVDANKDIGILIYDHAEVTLADVAVTGTLSTRGAYGRGINVQGAASLIATRIRVEGNTEMGLFVGDLGAHAEVTDSEFADTQPDARGDFGRGISVELGAELVASSIRVVRNTEIGIWVGGSGSRLDLSESEVADTIPLPGGAVGRGIEVASGGTLMADRVRVTGNDETGIHVGGDGAVGSIENSEVSGNGTGTMLPSRCGIEVTDGASIHVTGTRLAGNRGAGICGSGLSSTGENAMIFIDHSIIRGTRPSPTGEGGPGITVHGGVHVTADAVIVTNNAGVGVTGAQAGTLVEMTGSLIERTTYGENGAGGGISVEGGAEFWGEGLRIAGNSGLGVLAMESGSSLHLKNAEIVATGHDANKGIAEGATSQRYANMYLSNVLVTATQGPGLYASAWGRLECERCTISANEFAGAMAVGATLVLDRTTITGTAPGDIGGGIGVFASRQVFGPATVSLHDTVIGPHPYAAVWLSGQGTYELRRNDLSGSGGVALPTVMAHGNSIFAMGGVEAWDGASGLLLAGNTFRDSSLIGVFLHDAWATFDGNTWANNKEDLVQQSCGQSAPISDVGGAVDPVLCTGTNRLYDTSVGFDGLYLAEPSPSSE